MTRNELWSFCVLDIDKNKRLMVNHLIESDRNIVHYCWFGKNKLPEHASRVIESWRRYAPDYEIRCWNENNFDVNGHPFTKAAYESGKMAFVSDYVRFWAVYNYGGIYMDLGSELIRNIDELVSSHEGISAIERSTCTVNAGLFLTCKSHDSLVKEMLSRYDDLGYVNSDSFRLSHTVNEMFTGLLSEKGFQRKDDTQYIDGWMILSSVYFNPIYGVGGYHIKKNTYSIHKYTASWRDPKEKCKDYLTHRFSFFIGNRMGNIVARMIVELKFEKFSTAVKNILDKI